MTSNSNTGSGEQKTERSDRKLATPAPQYTDTPEDQIRHALYTYNLDTTAGGMDEEKAIGYFTAQLTALITSARIDELQTMIKMDEDYHKKLKADAKKGIYQPSFGSASGALMNAGWVNYFKDRIAELECNSNE